MYYILINNKSHYLTYIYIYIYKYIHIDKIKNISSNIKGSN